MDSITKTLSLEGDEEEMWIEQQYFRDHKHCEEVYARMIQAKSIESLG